MTDNQYDISPKMQELFNRKQEQRAAAKEFWRKQMYNPYAQGRPFDPVLMRYIGLSAYSELHQKETFKRKVSYTLFLAPFFIFGYFVYLDRTKREKLWQSGRTPYEQRPHKLFY